MILFNFNFEACLPYDKFYPTRTDIWSVVVGWGVLQEAGPEAETLENVRITIYEPEMCANSTYGIETNWESQICAGSFFIENHIP